MSLGVFVLAEIDEARPLAKQAAKGRLPNAVSLAGMNLIDLITLWQTLDPSSDHSKALNGSVRAGNGVAVPVSAPLCLQLSRIKEEEIPKLASVWSQAEEFRASIPSAELAVFLRDLSALARQGDEEKRAILFLNV